MAATSTSSPTDVQIRIYPDVTSLARLLRSAFLATYDITDFASYNGAVVSQTNGMPATDYVKFIADIVTGTYLDLGVRTNSVFSSYRLTTASRISQRSGDCAGPSLPGTAPVNISIQRVSSTSSESPTCRIRRSSSADS